MTEHTVTLPTSRDRKEGLSLDILMITHNRPAFTQAALEQLLSTCDDSMNVWVWHNGTDKKTLEVVKSFENHPRLFKLHISEENKKLREPTNWFWENSKAPYLSKVDDDCLLPEGWASAMIAAHKQSPQLGVIGAWRFYEEDFVAAAAEKKMVTVEGNQKIMRNPWVQGSGYVMKRECYEQNGPILDGESFPRYCIRVALSDWINGWYFPFIQEEHMDDPRSDYYPYKDDASFFKNRPLTAIQDGVKSIDEYKKHTKYMARVVQQESMYAKDYVGWRMRKRNLIKRLKKIFRPGNQWS